MKNVTHHAKQRINERGNNVINTSNKSLVKNAKNNGISFLEYRKRFGMTPLVKYTNAKAKKYPKGKIYFYLDYILCFNNNLTKLITLYPFLDKYKGEVDINLLREKIQLGDVKSNNSLINNEGRWKLYVTENDEIKEIGLFETKKNALKYSVEYFISSSAIISYYKNNSTTSLYDFADYLENNNMIKIENIDEVKKKEANSPILKEMLVKEESIYNAYILAGNTFILIGSYDHKRKAVAKIFDTFKDTIWYKKFIKEKGKNYKEKTNKVFYSYLSDLGLAIIVNNKLINTLDYSRVNVVDKQEMFQLC